MCRPRGKFNWDNAGLFVCLLVRDLFLPAQARNISLLGDIPSPVRIPGLDTSTAQRWPSLASSMSCASKQAGAGVDELTCLVLKLVYGQTSSPWDRSGQMIQEKRDCILGSAFKEQPGRHLSKCCHLAISLISRYLVGMEVR